MAGNEPTLSIFDKLLHLRRIRTRPTAVSAGELSVLADQMRDRVVTAGTALLREGEPAPAAFSLVRGRVSVSRRGQVLGEVGPGAVIGLTAMVSRDTEGLGAVASTDVFALELERERLMDVFDDHFPILLESIIDTTRRHLYFVRGLGRFADLAPGAHVLPAEQRTLDMVGRLLMLKRPDGPFAHTPLDALAEVAKRATHRLVAPGEALWREDDDARDAYIVVKGTLLCTLTSGDGRLRFRAGPGTMVGGLEPIAREPRWHDAVADGEPVEVLEHSIDDLIDVFEDNFEMAADFLTWVTTNSLNLIEKVSGPGPELLQFLTGAAASVRD